jgi:hypothetical protein
MHKISFLTINENSLDQRKALRERAVKAATEVTNTTQTIFKTGY